MVSIIFYLLLALVLISALFVISLKNPIHSVLFLILTFVNAAGVMIMLEAEYVAMITLIVYVGAVVTLFLFVVMMININLAEMQSNMPKTLPFAVLFVIIFLGGVCFALTQSKINLPAAFVENYGKEALFQNAVDQLGKTLYTKHILEFQIAGVILFLAMVGSITLVHRSSGKFVRKQDVYKQVRRSKADSIELVDVKSRSGVKVW